MYSENFTHDPILQELLQENISKTVPLSSIISPILPVNGPTGKYYSYNRGDFLRLETRQRAKGTEYPLKEIGATEKSTRLKDYGLTMALYWEDIAQEDNILGRENIVTQALWHDVSTSRDVDLINTINAAPWGQTTVDVGATVGLFSTTATPIIDSFRTWIREFHLNCGEYPNYLMIGQRVWENMLRNTEIKSLFTSRGSVDDRPTTRWFAEYLLPDAAGTANTMTRLEIIIPQVTINSAPQGASDVFVDVYSDAMWLGYVERAGIVTPGSYSSSRSALTTLSWTEFDAGRSRGIPSIEVMEDRKVKANLYRTSAYYKHETPDLTCGRRFTNIIA